jgi:hypothetical protein
MVRFANLSRRGARAAARVRPLLERYAPTVAKMNEQLSALAVALAIIVTLTAACRAPSYWADRSVASSVQQ